MKAIVEGHVIADSSDIVEGKRHARAAWSYEAPRKEMEHVAQRFGFWEDVEVV